MIKWTNMQNEWWEGTFESNIFHNEDDEPELSIGIENSSLADYAEKCVVSLNTLQEQVINEICEGITECAKQGGIDGNFELPENDNVLDILKYCWFSMVYVGTPESDDLISYVVEGEGEWGEVIGFAIENDKVVYVGVDYLEYINSER
ncbi:MAG: hypothetical protein IJ583_07830 [Firmicutes bacterium]|nr:hypothetical protein [Bacillota bacterium]